MDVKQRYIRIEDFAIFRKDRPRDRVGGGTAIFCKLFLDPTIIHLPRLDMLDIEYSAILINGITTRDKRLLIFSIYKPPNITLEKSKWQTFFDIIRELNADFSILICGDFNTHHSSWGSTISNAEGTAFADLLLISDFLCLNNDSITRISAHDDCQSVPDLTLCSTEIGDRFLWQTMDDSLGSDHIPILINMKKNLDSGDDHLAHLRPKLVTAKMNPDVFTAMVDYRMHEINSSIEKGSELLYMKGGMRVSLTAVLNLEQLF